MNNLRLLALMTTDSSAVFGKFLGAVAAELDDQQALGDTVGGMVHAAAARLDSATIWPTGQWANFRFNTNGPAPVRSVLDQSALPCARALQALCRCSKKAAAEVAAAPAFGLDASLRGPGPYMGRSVFSFGSSLTVTARQGAAIEASTLLGKLLRLGVDPRDANLADLLDFKRVAPQALEQNLAFIRSRHQAVVGSVAESVRLLLQAGGPAKVCQRPNVNFSMPVKVRIYRNDKS